MPIRRLRCAAAALATVFAAALAGCAGEGAKAGGASVLIAPADLAFTVTEFISPARIRAVERASPDNFRLIETVRFDQGGVIAITHLHNGFFRAQGERELNEAAAFEDWARQFVRAPPLGARSELREVQHQRHRSAGFVGAFATDQPGVRCIVARAGYRMATGFAGDNDEGTVTTLLVFLACGQRNTIDGALPLLTRLDRMDDAARERARRATPPGSGTGPRKT